LNWKPNTHNSRELEDHLGPNLGMKKEENHMLGLTLNLKGLEVPLPSRAEFNASGVLDRT